MKEILYDVLAHTFNSFNNDKKGYSAKKLTIFAFVLIVATSHYFWWKSDNFKDTFSSILIIDLSFITSLFGINVADKKINAEPKPTPEQQ